MATYTTLNYYNATVNTATGEITIFRDTAPTFTLTDGAQDTIFSSGETLSVYDGQSFTSTGEYYGSYGDGIIVSSQDTGFDPDNQPVPVTIYNFYSRTQYANGTYTYNQNNFTVCFVTGTRIQGPGGAVAVEDLAVGDSVVTASGAVRPIRWIGHRTMTCRGRTDVLPVRIAAHAFGEGRPARDLFVSPAHAVAVDVLGEVLIPACRLINGATITQVEAEAVTYWHVELDSHDILLAEGLPAESYLECGNRRFFANAEATDLLALPDARPAGARPFCRPLHEDGPLVDLVRARLTDRAQTLGWYKVQDTFAGLHLLADGETIHPDTDGLTARFVVPAEVRDLRLVSDASVPAHVVPGATDPRCLGLAVAALVIDDGLTGARAIALNDPRLGAGFHELDGALRWTDGAARLPAALWDGCRGATFLRLTLAAPALPRWVGPQADNASEARNGTQRNA